MDERSRGSSYLLNQEHVWRLNDAGLMNESHFTHSSGKMKGGTIEPRRYSRGLKSDHSRAFVGDSVGFPNVEAVP